MLLFASNKNIIKKNWQKNQFYRKKKHCTHQSETDTSKDQKACPQIC